MRWRFDNMDANEGAFLAEQLKQIRTKAYDPKLGALKIRLLVPVDNSVNPGASTVAYRSYTSVGMAKIISNYADDLPRSDVTAEEFSSPIKGLGTSYGYSVHDVRAAMFAGVPLEQKKANSARRSIEESIDLIGSVGDAANKLLGLINQPNAILYVVPNNAAGTSTRWKDKSADEIIADLSGIVANMLELTKEAEKPDTILVPLAQYEMLKNRRMGDGDATKILRSFLDSNEYIKEVIPWSRLKGAGSGGTDRMICYRRDPDALQLVISQEFEQFPPQPKGLQVITPCHARIGGVVMYYPMSMAYGDGI